MSDRYQEDRGPTVILPTTFTSRCWDSICTNVRLLFWVLVKSLLVAAIILLAMFIRNTIAWYLDSSLAQCQPEYLELYLSLWLSVFVVLLLICWLPLCWGTCGTNSPSNHHQTDQSETEENDSPESRSYRGNFSASAQGQEFQRSQGATTNATPSSGCTGTDQNQQDYNRQPLLGRAVRFNEGNSSGQGSQGLNNLLNEDNHSAVYHYQSNQVVPSASTWLSDQEEVAAVGAPGAYVNRCQVELRNPPPDIDRLFNHPTVRNDQTAGNLLSYFKTD